MKAKFVNEDFTDVLRSKSSEEIRQDQEFQNKMRPLLISAFEYSGVIFNPNSVRSVNNIIEFTLEQDPDDGDTVVGCSFNYKTGQISWTRENFGRTETGNIMIKPLKDAINDNYWFYVADACESLFYFSSKCDWANIKLFRIILGFAYIIYITIIFIS